jgi:hypothetical protein
MFHVILGILPAPNVSSESLQIPAIALAALIQL